MAGILQPLRINSKVNKNMGNPTLVKTLISYVRSRAFLTSFILVFVVMMLLNLGVRLPIFIQTTIDKLVTPLPQQEDNLLPLKSKLHEKPNSYKLKKSSFFCADNSCSIVPKAQAAAAYEQAAGYAVIDFESGDVIAEKNLSQKLPIASLTKIMMAVVALDLASPSEYLTVTQNAADQIPTKLVMMPGEKISVEELLHATLLTSANDAAEVIKDGINAKYGKSVFIAAMNYKAESLGLSNTHFENPQGFDAPAHYSTVEDVAILSHYALTKYPLIADIAKKDYQYLPADSNHQKFDLYNWNGLLGVYPGIFGLKIGNTGWAQSTTVVAAQRNGKKVLVVMLGAPGVLERDMWAAQLLDFGFLEKYGLPPVSITEEQLREKYSTWRYGY